MAESRLDTHPWDRDHSQEGLQAVSENETLHDALMDNVQQLSKKMKLSDTFWRLLAQRGVVDDGVKAKILAAKTVRAQAMALVQHLLTLEVYKLHGFVWALVNSNQCHMAELLGFSVDDYLDMEVFMMSSSFRCPACSEFYTKAYILTGCGHYVCAPCAKGAQFICKDNKKEDVTCPVPNCGKTTETSPSEESLGLDEDVAFKDLCEEFVKQFSEKGEYAKLKSEEAELMENNVDKMKVQIAKLKEKVASLEKFRTNLGQQEATLKDHVREKQEKIKQSVDDWAQENLTTYSSIEHQVDKKLHQSVQWEKAASELSIYLRTQPWFSEIGLTMEDVLTKEADSPIPKNTLMKDLDSGHSILKIVTPYELKRSTPRAVRPARAGKCEKQPGSSEPVPRPVKPPDAQPAPPTKAKFLVESHWLASKLTWMPDGDLLFLNCEGVFKLVLHGGTIEDEGSVIVSRGATDMGCSTNGTICATGWTPAYDYKKIWFCEYNGGKTRDIYLSEGGGGGCMFMNSCNIYISEIDTRRVHRYNLAYVNEGVYDIGLPGLTRITGYIHVTERDTLLASAPDENKIYMVDLKTWRSSYFTRTGGSGYLTSPQGVCSVNNGEHILVCDSGNDRVCVFSRDGSYLHDLVVDTGFYKPTCIAVLARPGQPTLLAVGVSIDKGATSTPAIRVYSLE